MANINRQWKRWAACGCSHGHLADPYALKTFLTFCERWKPVTRLHLGDYIDTAAFRTGAKNTKDENVPLESDLSAAITFLRNYRPTVLLNGNHDIRLWKNANHPNAIVAACAQSLIRDIKRSLPKDCLHIESYCVRNSVYRLADTAVIHGWKYNVNAIRDTARAYGRVLMAHLHRTGMQPADRIDGAMGYCCGYLGDPDKFDYAHVRQAMLEWQNGFAYGEYSDDHCEVFLCQRFGQEWRLPL